MNSSPHYVWDYLKNRLAIDPELPLFVNVIDEPFVNPVKFYNHINSLRSLYLQKTSNQLEDIRKTMMRVRTEFNRLGIGKLRLITSHASYNKDKLSLYFAVVSGVSSNSYSRIRVDDVNDYITNMDISIDDLELVANARFQCVFLNEQAAIASAQLRSMQLQQNEMDRTKELAVKLSNKWTD